jgi:hypothetical protein
MAELQRTTKIFKVDTELQAMQLIKDFQDLQQEQGYKVGKGDYTYKTKKQKGEIIDDWYIVTIQLNYI